MTLDEIKAAVDAGKVVCWCNDSYQVIKDKLGQYLIYHKANDFYVGLTHKDNVPLSGNEQDFYIWSN